MSEHESRGPGGGDGFDELERLIHAELRATPPVVAPASLLPRVLAATVHQAAPRWYARTWRVWLPDQRVAAACLALVAMMSALSIAHVLLVTLGLQSWAFDALPGAFRSGLVRLDAALAVCGALWNTLGAPLAAVVVPLILILGVACTAGGFALRNLVPGGTSHT